MTPARALLAWLVLLAVAFANGAVRVMAYPATLSDFAARQVAAGIGAVALGIAIWFLLRRWPIPGSARAATGALWAALTVAFEAAMTRAGGHPWSDVAQQYALWQGSLWPLLVLWVAAAPAALSALQRSGVAVGATLGWSIAGWLACGVVFAAARALFGTDAALWIHLAAAPAVGAGVALATWRQPRHPGIVGTALAAVSTPLLLDAVLVAPFLERSFAMFRSAAGTWLPLAAILGASAATAAGLARQPASADGRKG